ncbi:MAG: hypothetical protein EOP10_10345 [Proteobacteria bacterium]|nr:MAG: hypothetical protein EOP10_10345 [Pseudomonadota bacterium]
MDHENRRSPDSSRSNSSQSSSKPSTRPTLESVRVLRLAERLSLSLETMDKLKNIIFGPHGRDVSAIEARQTVEPEVWDELKTRSTSTSLKAYPAVEMIEESEIARLKTIYQTSEPVVAPPPVALETKSPSLPLSQPQLMRREERNSDELLLRKKIEASPIFTDFRGDAYRLFEKYPRPDVAGRLIELALMYGTVDDLIDSLRNITMATGEYYPLITVETRDRILLRLWTAKHTSFMDQFYFRKDLILVLTPMERWYITWSLLEQGKHDHLYRWYKRNEHEIWAMQKLFGPRLQKSESELTFAIGSAAFRMDDEDLALKMLESIPKSASEFSRAIDLLLDVRVERDDRGLSSYELRLSRELDWNARLGLFDSFLLRAQQLQQLAPRDRAALNALLVDPLRWFPESAEALNLVAQMLLHFSDLEKAFPNLLKLFHSNALQFQKPALEHALWTPVLTHDFGQPDRTAYWRSMAMVHSFALGLGQEEKKLWQAREIYFEAQGYEAPTKILTISWSDLHKALVQWISKSDRLDEADRKRLSMMAKLCGESREISDTDIRTYLADVSEPNLEVLETLQALARDRKQEDLELFILGRKAQVLHHTNSALARIWDIGVAQKKNDLSWRTATLLHVRQQLGPELEKPWLIVGEKRREFPMLHLSPEQLKVLCSTFDGNERKLVEAVVNVGPLIPELLASLNPNLLPQKRTRAISKTETEVFEFLEAADWLPSPKKQYGLNAGGLWQTRPPFFSNLTDGKWCGIFVGLSQRLGLNAWDWQLSLLNQQIEALIPRMTRSSETLQASKVGRWLRSLTPSQRKSWYDLAQVSKKFEDEQAQAILGRFLAILTTTLYQDHIAALATLERVRAPLRLRWDTENWIVSLAYGEIRKGLGSHTITRFPDNVYRMAVLSPKPPAMRS